MLPNIAYIFGFVKRILATKQLFFAFFHKKNAFLSDFYLKKYFSAKISH
jgi:hypothetical protein